VVRCREAIDGVDVLRAVAVAEMKTEGKVVEEMPWDGSLLRIWYRGEGLEIVILVLGLSQNKYFEL